MVETMTCKERMIAALELKPVDRVPAMQTDGGIWVTERAGISFADLYAMEDYGASLLVQASADMQMDVVNGNSGIWLAILNAAGCPVNLSQVGSPVEVSPCIGDPDQDIPKLDKSKIKENIANNELLQKSFKQVQLIKKLVGEEKLISCATVGPFSAANIMVGTEDFMVMMAEESEQIPVIMDYATAFCAEVVSQLFEAGADFVGCADPNSSGDMISQAMYEDVIEPMMSDYFAQIRNRKYMCYHICGQTTARIPSVSKMPFSAYSIDSVVDLKTALDGLKGKMAVMGNMNPAAVMLMGKAEDVYKECYHNVELAGLDGGYIIVPGCDIPAASPLENIHCMTKAARDYAATQK